MGRTQFKGLRVWVTGASTGIGRQCAIEFARRGARVAVSARSEDKLRELVEEIGSDRAFSVPFDVSDKDAHKSAVKTIEHKLGGIDMAFLNAGTWKVTEVDSFDSTLFESMMTVNYLGMVYSIEAVLPLLRKSKRPHLVGMSSSVAYRGLPRAEAYCASKAAIRAMLQGLRVQLYAHSVPVSIIMPGFVKTPLTDTNDFSMPFIVEVERAGEIIARGIEKQQHEITFPFPFITMLRFMAMLPSTLYTRMMARKVSGK